VVLLLSYGLNYKPSTLPKTVKMISLGLSWIMVNNPWLWLTRRNCFVQSLPTWIRWCGRFGHHQTPSPLLVLLSKIDCGQRIDWRREGGQIVVFIYYAREPQNRWHIVLCIVAPREFGPSLNIGLESLWITHKRGKWNLSTFGGITWPHLHRPLAKPWPR
jgi:hypothetical protein